MKQVFRNKYFLVSLFLLAFAVSASAQSGKRLVISANHRFFTDEKGAPFFWLGDTGWLLFSKLKREEAETYLEDRHKKGFNVIQVMVLHTVAAINAYGDSALKHQNVATPLTTPGSSFADAKQYDYWDHIDYIVDLAARKGIYMAMVPVWGSNVKSGLVKKEDAGIYAKFLADRYKNRWNIVWLNGGDIKGNEAPDT
ncbi:MAG TPA: DUF4038 domain-containing protein, partial [Flavisolibacter sp.]|nr:DUF4038 domain-containing protein [Flavisolibacter sp.]